MLNEDIITKQITDQIIALIVSENIGDSEIMKKILSKEFVAITRSSGIEETKDDLIKAIEKDKIDLEKKRELNKDYKKERKLDEEHIEVFHDENIAVSRSLITLTETGEKDTVYRNIHVFENHSRYKTNEKY